MSTNYILEVQLFKKSLVISAFALALFTGCNGTGSVKLSKEDSLKIAENYYQNHPQESKAIITWSKDTTPTTFLTQEEVNEYLERYHKNPALQNDKGTALNGFIFSGDNYKRFVTDPRLFGIYVGFASKPNGDFTVMFRGLNERGQFILDYSPTPKQDTSYSNMTMALEAPPPCPYCPELEN